MKGKTYGIGVYPPADDQGTMETRSLGQGTNTELFDSSNPLFHLKLRYFFYFGGYCRGKTVFIFIIPQKIQRNSLSPVKIQGMEGIWHFLGPKS